MTPEALLKAMFQAGVDAALPSLCVPAHLPSRPKGRTIIIGAGKASGAMAKALEDAWGGPLEGLVVTRYGYRVPTERLEVVEAAHPVPDAAGREAAIRIFKMVQGLTQDDLVLCLISGGGSALLALPAEGITLEDKQAVNKALLKSGATISEMNTVRKHLSAIKGGRLAKAAYPARVVALMISDVPGDDPSIIASGPTVPDPSTNADALAIIEKYKIEVPDERAPSLAHQRGDAEARRSLLRPRGERHDRHAASILGGRRRGRAQSGRHAGDPRRLDRRRIPRRGPGPCRHRAAMRHARPTREAALRADLRRRDHHHAQRQGQRRPQHRVPAGAGHRARRLPNIYALAGDTDGVDGSEDNAGALIYPDTLARAEDAGLNPKAMLADNDPYTFFKGIGDLLETGPTLTNVNDLRAILIEKS